MLAPDNSLSVVLENYAAQVSHCYIICLASNNNLTSLSFTDAFGYLECSAKTKDGVREVFETATRAALQVKKKKRRGCVLL